MTLILGLAGPKGSGKSTIAGAVQEILGENCRRYSFADPMKEMIIMLMHYGGIKEPRGIITDPILKELDIPELQGASYRHLMQTLGTEWGRDLMGEDLWRDICFARIERDKPGLAIIDDVRFASEVEGIKDRKGLVGLIHRPDKAQSADNHPSEAGVTAPPLLNDGTPHQVAEKLLIGLKR